MPDEYLAPRFPDLIIAKLVTPVSEISRTIESSSSMGGPSKSDLESIDVEDFEDHTKDFDVTSTEYESPWRN